MREMKTFLLVDDHSVLYRPGTERVVTPLQRHEASPVIVGQDKPWEVAVAWTSVYRDPVTGFTQMWYQAYTGDGMPERTQDCVTCYAESDDGIVFRKPELDLFPFGEIKRTNIVMIGNGGYSYRYGNFVVVDPEPADEQKRYKMAYFDFGGTDGKEDPGLFVAFSPDGIHWTKHRSGPVSLMTHGKGRLDDVVPHCDQTDGSWLRPLVMSDALDVLYDPVRQCYAIYGKMWINGPDGRMFWKHAMGRIESRDFINWSKPELLMSPDEKDAPSVEFHTTPVFYHADCYISLMQILDRGTGGGVINIELAISRDGLAWQRPFRDSLVLERGEDGAFDSGSIFTNATPVVLPDEIRFYYGGYSGGATAPDNRGKLSGVGLATIPRDRFAGIRPSTHTENPLTGESFEHIGQITLKPIEVVAGCELMLNANASAGAIHVEVLDDNGYLMRGFSKAEATPITGDALRHPVRWRNQSLAELAGKQVMLRLHLEKATAYAVYV